ncbi:MAG: ATP-binding protein [Burkholderiales bacterium]|nr:MAG: ATP-binding protein [Burkholderiales bacterium]
MSTAQVDRSRGSLWHRWDPHIHAPGTAMNDQYKGADPWADFASRVAGQTPPIRALGITDYYLIDTYERAVAESAAGRMPGVEYIFPNVEIRLSNATSSDSAVNAHLLFSTDDPDHVSRIRGLMAGFSFRYLKDQFRCERADLIRLGRSYDKTIVDDQAALTAGVNQFKISFEDLQEKWDTNDWFRNNCLIAVAGGQNDGTSGLRDPSASFGALRVSIEAFAHIIFSGNPRTADFYLGKGVASLADLNAKWGGVKPCLHGSDAHSHGQVGKPALDRFCWLKGALTFETLRQACLNPEGRACIGKTPPAGPLPSDLIRSVNVSNAPWMAPSTIELNPGLVAIIGARGSGKTALADLIAMGGCAALSHLSEKSFLRRAASHLSNSEARLHWESGEQTYNQFSTLEAEELLDAQHVQYLSQQFVDQLCSAEGLEDPLRREIERVVFDAHAAVRTIPESNFAELLSNHLAGARRLRDKHVDAVADCSENLALEQARRDGLAALKKEREEKQKAIAKDEADMRSLMPKGDAARVARHTAVAEAAQDKRTAVLGARNRLDLLRGLEGDVARIREEVVPGLLDDLMQDRGAAGLKTAEWEQFRLVFSGDVSAILKEHIGAAERALAALEGKPLVRAPGAAEPDPNTPLLPDSGDLSVHTLSLLEQELQRLRKLIGMDETNARRYKTVSERVNKAKAALLRLNGEITKSEGAMTRIETLRQQRHEAYVGVFQAILEEENALKELYGPLRDRIADATGSLAKLQFTVRRDVDIDAWCEAGEALLDLRAAGAFRGRGSMKAVVELSLGDAWRSGDAEQAGSALRSFLSSHSNDLRAHRPADADPKEWLRQVSSWLFGTKHIRVSYGLQFDGVPIERLSPGTRGIVLLLLYLAVDTQDDRPLIVDQPEENLDPQSIYDELVAEFQRAKQRRQVIIVTHNANLVVNTDADQVIVTRSGGHVPGQLPRMNYISGGLEEPKVREAVCAILEGGKRAFQERAKRLRVAL